MGDETNAILPIMGTRKNWMHFFIFKASLGTSSAVITESSLIQMMTIDHFDILCYPSTCMKVLLFPLLSAEKIGRLGRGQLSFIHNSEEQKSAKRFVSFFIFFISFIFFPVCLILIDHGICSG